VWLGEDLITFWEYPSPEKFNQILVKLEDMLDMYMGEFMIELPIHKGQIYRKRISDSIEYEDMKSIFVPASKYTDYWNNKMITEDAEIIKIPSIDDSGDEMLAHYNSYDARAFGYISDHDDYEEDEIGVMKIGRFSDDYHYELTYNKRGQRNTRYELDYPGRLWYDKKLISFWVFPPKGEMKQVLSDIEQAMSDLDDNYYEELNFSDPDWRIEVISSNDYDESNPPKFWSRENYISELIPLEDYSGSEEWDKETLMKAHTLSPQEKEQLRQSGLLASVPKGIGSRVHDEKLPKGMTPAEYKNKKTKYMYTENFDISML